MTYQPELPIPDPHADRLARQRRARRRWLLAQARQLRRQAREQAARLRDIRPEPTPDQEEQP